MYKLGVMGDRDSIYGFSSVGADIFPVEDPAEGARLLRQIADEYAVLFITEKLAAAMDAELSKYRARTVPAIIPIPGVSGNTGIGMKNVSRSVEQAVGSDILPD
ncbi:MAG: V-type ATP synthase subunit F [Clostridia bacterium]|nr:V-type ATP synthase subunit F [Clostridia bacterium]MBR0508875.1 V-type ATP synthase subunit F [Clostridia bacterium]MBR0536950.1 V-type ATP synthase subunit F [Clostridia bacterium]